MPLSISEHTRLEKIVTEEGKIIEFMKHNSAIVSIKTQRRIYETLHIQLVEIFVSKKYPIGQLLDLNKHKLMKYFPENINFSNYLEKCIKTENVILVIIGADYLSVNHYFIWDGSDKPPWEIVPAHITKEIINMTNESIENLTNIISKIKYRYIE